MNLHTRIATKIKFLTPFSPQTKVYLTRAQEFEAGGDYETAIELYRKSISSARACGDVQAEGQSNYRAGRAYVLLEKPEEAIDYLQQYVSTAVRPSHCLYHSDRFLYSYSCR